MATVSTIGTTGRNYSTNAAWLAAFAPGGWEGEQYNDSEFLITTTLSFSGHAVSIVNYIKLSAAAGQGFRDNANALTNALRYNVANGVGIRTTTRYINTITVSENFVTIFGLQISQASVGTGGGAQPYSQTSGATSNVLDSCILENISGTANVSVVRSNAGTIKNVLAIQRGAAGDGFNFGYPSGTVQAFNCTIARPSDIAAAGFVFQSAAGNWKAVNCAGFGFSTFNTGGTPTGCSNNASDLAIGIGTANQASKTYASQFQNTLDATRDFRAKSGGDLPVNGTATGAPAADIIGTVRANPPTIGCWEVVSVTVAPFFQTDWQNPRAAIRFDQSAQPQGSPAMLLAAPVAPPIINKDFQNPRVSPPPMYAVRLGSAPILTVPFGVPVRPIDWPVPRLPIWTAPAQPLGAWMGLAAPIAAPIRPIDWPMPRGPAQPIQMQAMGVGPAYIPAPIAAPFAQRDWPVPRGLGRPDQTQPQGAWTFLSVVPAPPIRPLDWPIPRSVPRPDQTQPQGTWAFITAAPAAAPFIPQIWINPPQAPAPAQTQPLGTWAGLVAPISIPVRPVDWPAPRAAAWIVQAQPLGTWAGLATPAAFPVRPVDWPNPRPAFRPDFSQPLGGVIRPVGPKPFAQYDWPIPRCPIAPIQEQQLGVFTGGLVPPIPTICHTVSGIPRVRDVSGALRLREVDGDPRVRTVIGGCC